MALKENRAKKTPEEVKLARAKRIKDRSLAIYTAGVGSVLTAAKVAAALDATTSEEGAMSVIKSRLEGWASASIIAAQTFDKVWKKKKGEFTHDDA